VAVDLAVPAAEGARTAKWIETVRGTAAPWECDITEHFTIAYYADRIDQATATLAEVLGLSEAASTGVFPRRFTLRFMRELRAGASFHVESAAIGIDPVLRLGHRFIDSASGETAAWVEEIWEAARLPAATRTSLNHVVADWNGPETEERPDPASTEGAIATACGRVRPADLDEFGHFSLAAFIHRFTDALIQLVAAIGMTSEYMTTERRGYSTFELVLRIARGPGLGDRYLVETGIAHLGNSSIRLLHRMTDPKSGAEFARLGQFGVQLDLDTRRPAPLPPAIRAAAVPLVLRAN
jgi:acyl-CoA thioesterase FadM